MPVTFYGPRGITFESIEEAWTVYFDELYGDFDQISAEEYHNRYLIFTSGVLAGLNIVACRFNKFHREDGHPDGTSIRNAMVTVINEAMVIAKKEYKETGRNKE